jgi:hypothetical protein
LRAARGSTGAVAGFFRSGNSLITAAAILAQAHVETLLSLPSLLRKRAAIRNTRKLDSTEFARLMGRYRISAKDLARA